MKNFTMVPNGLITSTDFDVYEKCLLTVMLRFRPCHPAIRTLAKMARMNERTVSRKLRILREKGLKWEKGSYNASGECTPNKYFVHDFVSTITGLEVLSTRLEVHHIGQAAPTPHDTNYKKGPAQSLTNKIKINKTNKKRAEKRSADLIDFKKLEEIYLDTFGRVMDSTKSTNQSILRKALKDFSINEIEKAVKNLATAMEDWPLGPRQGASKPSYVFRPTIISDHLESELKTNPGNKENAALDAYLSKLKQDAKT